MPMYRGGNEMLSAYSANTEVCHGYVNGVRVFNCNQEPPAPTPMIWVVDATGSDNYEFHLNTKIGWNYNFVVNWGDGTEDTITTPNDPNRFHTYPAIEQQRTITITGLCEALNFDDDVGNAFLLLDVTQWGDVGLTTGIQMYGNSAYNCAFTATDAGGTALVVSMLQMFNELNANPYVDEFDVSSCTVFSNFMSGCANANPDFSSWDMSNALTIQFMMWDCPTFTGTGVPLWNTEKLQTATSAFKDCPQFDQDLSGWNIGELTAAGDMLSGSGFSRPNYDLLLIAWAAQAPNIQSTVAFHAGIATYTTGGAAQAGRDLLTGTYGWIIVDGGGVAP